MIQISKDDAAFILDELNNRAQHQINAYGAASDDLMGVINDLEAQLGLGDDSSEDAPVAAPAAEDTAAPEAPVTDVSTAPAADAPVADAAPSSTEASA
jgi:hypothetical protein